MIKNRLKFVFLVFVCSSFFVSEAVFATCTYNGSCYALVAEPMGNVGPFTGTSIKPSVNDDDGCAYTISPESETYYGRFDGLKFLVYKWDAEYDLWIGDYWLNGITYWIRADEYDDFVFFLEQQGYPVVYQHEANGALPPGGCVEPCDENQLQIDAIVKCEAEENIAFIDYESCTPHCYTSTQDDSLFGNDDGGICPEKEDTPQMQGNPINILNGNKFESATDLLLPSPHRSKIKFDRFYNSQSTSSSILGYGWTHSLSINLDPNVNLDGFIHIRIESPSGRGYYFKQGVDNRWDGTFGKKSYVLVDQTLNTYTWYKQDGTAYGFNDQGKLAWFDDIAGNRQSLTYNETSGLLETLDDAASDRTLSFSYYANNLLHTIAGPITESVPDSGNGFGIWVTYEYDAINNLTSVTYADGSGFTYVYNDPNESDPKHNLTEKKDKLNHQLAAWSYTADDKGISSTTRDDKDVAINYVDDQTVEVTDAYGVTRTFTIELQNLFYPQITNVTGPGGCTSCTDDLPIRYEYDGLNISEKEYANGKIIKYENYDERGNPAKVSYGSLDDTTGVFVAERVINTTYHEILNTPLERKETSVLGIGDKVTIWDYDNDGNDTPNETPTLLVYKKIKQGFSKDNTGAVVAFDDLITRYQYSTVNGQLTSVNGPQTGTLDTTSYTYDTNGNLSTITMPLGAVITLDNYDTAGNPGRMIDENGQETTFTYDGRNRLLSTTTGLIASTRTFNAAGDLDLVTLPGGRELDYLYNPIGFLEKIKDSYFNYQFYDYDDFGNVITDATYDGAGNLKRIVTYNHQNPDDPGKLWKIINPDQTETIFGYDEVDNLTSVTDPLGRTTSYQYDVMKRLEQMVQPGATAPTTDYTYDSQGNLTTVNDAASKDTVYEYDDMGRVIRETSPDSAVDTTYVYDTALNTIKATNANGETTYSFDARDRLVSIVYSDASQITFSYDEDTPETFHIGRMTGMTYQPGETSYGYDLNAGTLVYEYSALGQLAKETRTDTGMPAAVTAYGYDPVSADLQTITYPSGLVVSYGYNLNGQVNLIQADGQDLIKNINYMPFGPVSDYEYDLNAGTLGVDRTINQLYQVDRIQAGSVMDYNYGYYADGSVASISGVTPIEVTTPVISDIHHNTGTNQIDFIDTITPPSLVQYSHDENGNITSDGTRTFVYNKNNRLIVIHPNGDPLNPIATYSYDGYGRRVKKEAGGSTVYYHYDQYNNLIAETDGTGAALKDYIYLGSEPMAMKVYGAQAGIYYFLNDHQGTPQKMVDTTGAVVWEAGYLPFGDAQVKIETITNNLRFPGQYFDAETGLHYNWNRYYDPSTGRYLTPDPIGLAGGINPFLYANQNPINYIDPYGLFDVALTPYATALAPGLAMLDSPFLPFADAAAGAMIGLAMLHDTWPDNMPTDGQCHASSNEESQLDPDKPARDVLPGKLKREFPGEHADKSLNQIKEALKGSKGVEKRSLQKAKKILEQRDRLMGK